MQGAPRAVLFLGRGGRGLHQQDNDKPTRLFSLCSRVTLTMSFSQATVRGRVKQRVEWKERNTFLSTVQKRKYKIRLCTLKQLTCYNTYIRDCSLLFRIHANMHTHTYTKKYKNPLWHSKTNGIQISPPRPPTTPVQLWHGPKHCGVLFLPTHS